MSAIDVKSERENLVGSSGRRTGLLSEQVAEDCRKEASDSQTMFEAKEVDDASRLEGNGPFSPMQQLAASRG